MALTSLQRSACRLLAQTRIASGVRSQLRAAAEAQPLRFHAGSICGALPQVVESEARARDVGANRFPDSCAFARSASTARWGPVRTQGRFPRDRAVNGLVNGLVSLKLASQRRRRY